MIKILNLLTVLLWLCLNIIKSNCDIDRAVFLYFYNTYFFFVMHILEKSLIEFSERFSKTIIVNS